jgi:Zn-dependent metalloprotease
MSCARKPSLAFKFRAARQRATTNGSSDSAPTRVSCPASDASTVVVAALTMLIAGPSGCGGQSAHGPDSGNGFQTLDGGLTLDNSATTTPWKQAQEAFEGLAGTTSSLGWNDSLGSPSFVAFDRPYTVPGVNHDPAHPESTALAFLELSRTAWGARPADTFQTSSTSADLPGPVSATLAQVYRGVPVDGARLTVVMSKTGQIEFATGGFLPSISLDVNPAISKESAVALVVSSGGTVDVSQVTLSIRVDMTASPSAALAWRIPYLVNDQSGTTWVDAKSGSVLAKDIDVPSGLYQEIYNGERAVPDWSSNNPPPPGTTDAFKVYDATTKFDTFINSFGFHGFTGHDDWYRNFALAQAGQLSNCQGACFMAGTDIRNAISEGRPQKSLYGTSVSDGPKAVFEPTFSGLDQVSHEWGHGFTWYSGMMADTGFDQSVLHEAIADSIASLVVCAQPTGCTWQVHAMPISANRDLRDPSSTNPPWYDQNLFCPLKFAENYNDYRSCLGKYYASTAFSHAFYLFACDRGGASCSHGIGQRKAGAILLRAIWYRGLASSKWNTLADARAGLVRTCQALARESLEGITQADCSAVDQVFADLGYPGTTSQEADYALAPLSAPTNVGAVYQETTGSNHVTWYAVRGATKFAVHWATSSPVTAQSPSLPATTLLYADHSAVVAGLTYHYRVAAVAADGREGPLSDEVSAVATGRAIPDASPDGPDEGPRGQPQLTITPSSPSFDAYLVGCGATTGITGGITIAVNNTGGSPTGILTVSALSPGWRASHGCTGVSLQPGASCMFWLDLTTAAGTGPTTTELAVSDGVFGAKVTATATVKSNLACLDPPTGLTVSNSGTTNTVAWNATPGATSYELFWGTANGVTTGSEYAGETPNTIFAHTGVSAGYQYCYRVRAKNASYSSELSSEACVKTPAVVRGDAGFSAEVPPASDARTDGVVNRDTTAGSEAILTIAPETPAFTAPLVGCGSTTVMSGSVLITVSNSGNVASGNLTIWGLDAGWQAAGDCAGAPLQPGSSCTLSVSLANADGPGQVSTAVYVGDGVANTKVRVFGTITDARSCADAAVNRDTAPGSQAVLTITPSTPSFTAPLVGCGSTTVISGFAVLTVSNSGSAASGNLTVSVLSSGWQAAGDCAGAPLQPGSSCTLSVSLANADGPGQVSTTVYLGDGVASTNVTVLGTITDSRSCADAAVKRDTAPGGQAVLTITPATPSFTAPLVGCGSTTVMSGFAALTVSNSGTAASGNLTISGLNAGWQAAGNCAGASLQPGSSCTLSVSLANADGPGQVSTPVYLGDGVASTNVTVVGTITDSRSCADAAVNRDSGSQAVLTITPSSPSFTAPLVGCGSTTVISGFVTLTVSNTGGSASGSLTASGLGANWSPSKTCWGTSLQPGESCAFTVVLASADGPGQVTTAVTVGDGVTSTTVTVVGTITDPNRCDAAINPDMFGSGKAALAAVPTWGVAATRPGSR